MGWGQVAGTVTLTPGQGLTLSTGAIASYSGDLIFEGNLQFGTSLYAYNYSTLSYGQYFGSAAYCGLTQLSVSGAVSSYPIAPYAPPTSLVAGDIVLVRNGNEVGKILVVADSSSSVTLQYEVWGVPVKSPYINQISNNYSFIGSCAANYGIAPGSIFYVAGVGLSSTATAVLQSSAGTGLPLTLNGTSIAVTVNGVTTHPALYYSTPYQLAAVLPSSTPIGTGTITVSYNGAPGLASAIQVVPSAMGLDSLDGTGTGIGVATDAVTGSLISYTASATPGQNIVMWGSGLGADVADSDTTFTSTPHAVNVPLTVYICGFRGKAKRIPG